jgi:heparosan-N-sulfate-glucuronate 5-epimerase
MKIGAVQSTDDAGVIMLDYKGTLGLQYNPNATAQLALGYYDRILSGEDRLDDFLRQASYFLDHGRVAKDGILLWEYNFPFEMRNQLQPPWRSALAQGQGISVCLRAYQLTGDERYLDASVKAFAAFRYLARDHAAGVIDDSRGYTWLEEYLVSPPNHVLNGFIWALWGVRDYAVFLNDGDAWELWRNCLRTLRENLTHYDVGFWTTYDLVKFGPDKRPVMPSSLYYQRLHVVQMEAMHRLTSEPAFDRYGRKWRLQYDNFLNRILSQLWKAYFKVRWF